MIKFDENSKIEADPITRGRTEHDGTIQGQIECVLLEIMTDSRLSPEVRIEATRELRNARQPNRRRL